MTVQPISLDNLKRAEDTIVHFCQHECFAEEFETLQMDDHMKSHSLICKLDPILKNLLLHVGGILGRLAMPDKRKHPLILPKNHHVLKPVLRHIHD